MIVEDVADSKLGMSKQVRNETRNIQHFLYDTILQSCELHVVEYDIFLYLCPSKSTWHDGKGSYVDQPPPADR